MEGDWGEKRPLGSLPVTATTDHHVQINPARLIQNIV